MAGSAETDGGMAHEADWKFRQAASAFARQGYAIGGRVDPAWLGRTANDSVLPRQLLGAVRSANAGVGERPAFVVSVEATVGLVCQSCSAPFDQAIDSSSTVWVAADRAELARWDEAGEASAESIEGTERVSALELVEDELLLSLPYVARCPVCAASDEPRRHEFS